ncbi:hypothetical protein [Sansalvadorimonas verongulae]|uniref:hypothetical protein n=1 Tax=Sansalvadorimonas verongulae TaxID=2172824 RepID=UPI0012BCA145|nr:hypothetical protein [Sansalvadorimonas verongulae]MTI12625.1 hypothetical protein [Sansalvadorimonas verongulae]
MKLRITMDGQNRSNSQAPHRYTRPSTFRREEAPERSLSTSSVRRSPSRRWSVREAPAQTHFASHPMVFRLQLQHAIGRRVVTRIRELAKSSSLIAFLRSHHSQISEPESLELAQKHSALLNTFSNATSTSEELEHHLESLVHNPTLGDTKKAEVISLLSIMTDDDPDADSSQAGITEFNSLMTEYTPRALAIFLNTGFGSYVLDSFRDDHLLSEDDRTKMGKGLLHIQSRLNARASHLPDGPLIEYADLYMGEDIDLEDPDYTIPVAMKTLENIREQHEDSLAESVDFRGILKSGAADRHLPIALKEIERLRMENLGMLRQSRPTSEHPVVSVARHIDNYPELRVLLKDEELSHEDLEHIATHLQTIMEGDEKAIYGLQTLEEKLKALPTEENELSDTTLAELSGILKEAAKLTTSNLNKTTLELLRNHINAQVFNRTRERFEKELYQQLRFLEKGGSEKTFTVAFNIGAAASVAGADSASLGAKVEFTFKVTGNDDTKIRVFYIVKPMLTFAVGNPKLLEGSLEAGLAHSNGRVFRNLEEFVAFHSNDLVATLMGTASNALKNTKGSRNVRKAQSLHHKVTADRHLLSQRLTELGVIHPGDQIRVKQKAAVNYADFTQHTVSTTAKVKALAGTVEADATYQKKKTHFTTRTNLLFMLRNNPDKAQPKHVSYMSFWVPASPSEKDEYEQLKEQIYDGLSPQKAERLDNFKEEDGIVSVRRSGKTAVGWMDEQAACLERMRALEENPNTPLNDRSYATRERLAIRETLKKAIVDQHIERDMYYFTVNAMEGSVGEEAPQKSFHDIKRSMQRTYGAKDRGRFIAAHIYSFYHLHQLYKDTFLPLERPEENDPIFHAALERTIEPSLDKPELNLEASKHVRRSLTATSSAKSTESVLSTQLSFAIPKTNIGISADIKHSTIGKNVNPDNDGNYFNLGLNINSGSATTAVAIKSLQKVLASTASSDKGADNLPELTTAALAGLIPHMPSFDVEAGMRIEFNLVQRHKDWRLQYVRLMSTDKLGLSIPEIGIPTGPIGSVKIGASTSVASAHNWWEQPGDNTLTYITAKYNGWKAGQMQRTPSWSVKPEEFEELTRKEGGNPFIRYTNQHKKAVSKLLVNMGKEDTNTHQEFIDMLEQLDDTAPPGYPGFLSHFKQITQDYAANPDIERVTQILPEFERFMAMHHDIYLQEARSRYQPNYVKGRII